MQWPKAKRIGVRSQCRLLFYDVMETQNGACVSFPAGCVLYIRTMEIEREAIDTRITLLAQYAMCSLACLG